MMEQFKKLLPTTGTPPQSVSEPDSGGGAFFNASIFACSSRPLRLKYKRIQPPLQSGFKAKRFTTKIDMKIAGTTNSSFESSLEMHRTMTKTMAATFNKKAKILIVHPPLRPQGSLIRRAGFEGFVFGSLGIRFSWFAPKFIPSKILHFRRQLLP